MPACLFNTNSFCHTQTHIRDGWHTKPCAAKTDSAQCVFLSLLSAVRRKSQPVSTAIAAHHCLVLSHYPAALSGGAAAAAAVLNFETDRPSVGCQIGSGKWPAYSPSLSTCCRRLPWQRHISAHHRQTNNERRQTDTEKSKIDLFILLQCLHLGTFSLKTNQNSIFYLSANLKICIKIPLCGQKFWKCNERKHKRRLEKGKCKCVCGPTVRRTH